jgi:hypothetical protein
MKISTKYTRRFHYVCVSRPADFMPQIPGLYPALVWNCRPDVTTEEARSLMRTLMASGCRFIAASGVDCDRWHDIADDEFVEMVPDEEWQERFVMTSRHEGDLPEEVMYLLANLTNFNQHSFTDFLVLQIGEDATVRKKLQKEIQRHSGFDSN